MGLLGYHCEGSLLLAEEGGKELQIVMPSFCVPACCVCPAAAHNGRLVNGQCTVCLRGPSVQHCCSTDLPGNKSWSQTGSTKGLVLLGQLGLQWLAGHHTMLYILMNQLLLFLKGMRWAGPELSWPQPLSRD